MGDSLKFIDLFAGIGGFRIALERHGAKCVFSSEWDKEAQKTYKENFGEMPHGDITKIKEADIPKHDVLCAGFPCQAFSISEKQRGFNERIYSVNGHTITLSAYGGGYNMLKGEIC